MLRLEVLSFCFLDNSKKREPNPFRAGGERKLSHCPALLLKDAFIPVCLSNIRNKFTILILLMPVLY